MNTRHLLWTAAVAWLAPSACAPRTVPAAFPDASAASAAAPLAEPASVTAALDEDPPLPGEDGEGWPGLATQGGAEPPGHGHHGHHGPAAPPSQSAPEEKEAP